MMMVSTQPTPSPICEPDRRTASAVDHHLLIACLDQRGSPKCIDLRVRNAGPEERDLELVFFGTASDILAPKVRPKTARRTRMQAPRPRSFRPSPDLFWWRRQQALTMEKHAIQAG